MDGRPVSAQGNRRQSQRGIGRRRQLTIPEKDAEVSIIAESRYAASVPSTILRWQGREEFVIKPKLYVLSIGVNNYQDGDLTLRFAAKDAEDFAKSMERQKGAVSRCDGPGPHGLAGHER